MSETREFSVKAHVRKEDGWYWGEVEELPGCFASGRTMDELLEALTEAITLYLQGEGQKVEAHVADVQPAGSSDAEVEVDELKLCVTA
jgi:predicted RNase H-like HicB family nuclease